MIKSRTPVVVTLAFVVALSVQAQSPKEHITAAGPALMSGQLAAAKVPLTKALEGIRQLKDVHGEGATLILLGMVEIGTNNIDTGRAYIEEAVTKLRAGNDAFGAWMALLVQSQMERALGRFPAAMTSIESALAVLNEAKTSDAPFTLATLVTMAQSSGGGPEVQAQLQILPMLESQGDLLKPMMIGYFAEPITHDMYGSLLTDVGQFGKAEAELNAAAAGAQFFGGMYDFSLAAHFGDLRYRQKRYDEARAQYQKALNGSLQTPLNPLGDHWVRVVIYDRLANIEMIEGRIDEALRWNDKSVEISRSGGNPLQLCVTLTARGRLLARSTRSPDAEGVFNEALQLAEANKLIAQQADLEGRLGGLYVMSGRYGPAASHLETAIRLYQTLNDPISEAAEWGTLANVYLLTASSAAAEDSLKRARDLADKSRFELGRDLIAISETWIRFRKGTATLKDVNAALDHLLQNKQIANLEIADDIARMFGGIMRTLQTGELDQDLQTIPSFPTVGVYNLVAEGFRQFQRGEVEEARSSWEKALHSNPGSDLRVTILGIIGGSYWRERDYEQASAKFEEATRTLDKESKDLPSDAMLAGYFGNEHRAYYDVQIETLLRAGKIEQALDVTERARSRAFLRLLGNNRIKLPAGESSALAKEVEDLRRSIETTTDRSRLTELRTKYEALLTRLQAASPEYAAMTNVEPFSLNDVRKELPADTTLISYFVTPFGVNAWVLDARNLDYARLPIDPTQLERIKCWATQIDKPSTQAGTPPTPAEQYRSARAAGPCGADIAKPEQAYAALFAPLRDKIHTTRLMIVPHAELHYVPFAALRDPRGQYLVQDYTITYLPSANTLRFLRTKETKIEGKSLVLGDPESPTAGGLGGARKEAIKVASLLNTEPKLGKDASEDLLYHIDDIKPECDLVHIAAHARYDADQPLFSAIALAKGAQKNGLLTVDEIQSEIDFKGVNLVVLAACESGVGKRSGGDEIVGLTRAILYAGSPRVISTLWNVSDVATTPLIETFYRHLLAGEYAADALRSAQVELLTGTDYREISKWGAFILTGDPMGCWKPPCRRAESSPPH